MKRLLRVSRQFLVIKSIVFTRTAFKSDVLRSNCLYLNEIKKKSYFKVF